MANAMILGGLQRTTLIDFPGRVSCTVFVSGCNFRCPFCYSPELVLPQKIAKHPQISEKDFFSFLKKRKGLLDGVVICGGEPTLNKYLPAFCEKIKKMGFMVKLDTNGSNPEMLKKLIDKKLVDYIAMDVKQSHSPAGGTCSKSKGKSQKYDDATGVHIDLNKIRESINIIKNSGTDYEFRTTVVPGIHKKKDILDIAEWLSPAKKYYLQKFRPEKNLDPACLKMRPYSDEWFSEVKREIKEFFKICDVRG